MLKSWLLQEKLFFYTPPPLLYSWRQKTTSESFLSYVSSGSLFWDKHVTFPGRKDKLFRGIMTFPLLWHIDLCIVYRLDKSYLGHLWIWMHEILTGHWLMYRVGFDLQLKAYLRHQYSLLFGLNKTKIHQRKFSRKTRHNFFAIQKNNFRGIISCPKGNISTWLWISEEKCNNWLKL